eukprot:g26867.t1
MRWKDAELEELLLTQGFIVAEELGDVYLARVLEAWSRMGSTDPEAVDRSKQMVHNICGPGAQKHRELGHDLRDALNVLATLTRMCPKSQERSTLEAHLASQLSAVNSTEAMLALQWLQRLALDSAPIWKACAEVTELALEEKNFVRDHFAHAVHCLASVAGEQTQAALISQLISSPEVKHGAPRLSAEKTLQVLHAASMMDLKDSVVADWESQAARLARQMSLPDRRTLRIISDARPTASKLKTAMAQLRGAQVQASQALIARRCLKFRFMMHDAWENALFVHWPVPAERLAEMLPRGLEPDIMDGTGWIGLVLLTERGVSSSHPLGRMFRTVDMEPFAKKTDMKVADPGFTFDFSSRRTGIFSTPGVSAKWQLSGKSDEDRDEDFTRKAEWFVERYSVYAAWPWGKGPLLLRGDVQHPEWPLQRAVIESLDASELLEDWLPWLINRMDRSCSSRPDVFCSTCLFLTGSWTSGVLDVGTCLRCDVLAALRHSMKTADENQWTTAMPIAHLPPLRVSPESDELEAVQIGGDVLLQPKGGGKEGIKYMGHWDSLVGRGKPKGQSSPSCQLSIRAFKQHKWTAFETSTLVQLSNSLQRCCTAAAVPKMPKAKLKRPSKAKRKAKCKPEATNTVASTCEVERMRKVKEPFLDMFVSALTKGDPDPSEMAWHLTWRCIDAWRSDAPAACSLMLFSEALPGHVNLCDVLEAIDYHHYVRGEIGSDRLDLSCLQESWGMTLPDVQLQGLY